MAKIIKERIDSYPLTHVDCIEKAICSMLNEYEEKWASVYLMYNNWFGCYALKQQMGSEIEVLEYLCSEGILPIEFHVKEVADRPVAEEVEKLLNAGALCLAPANLYELYYSKYYHSCDWPHLFLVRECNQKERLFYIMDSCQKSENEQVFSPFVLEYDKLNRIYKSYCDTYPNNMMYRKANVIYYFELKSKKDKEVDQVTISRNLLEQLPGNYQGQKERQLLMSLMKPQSSNSKETHSDIVGYLTDEKIRFNHLIKRKSVFYSEMIYNIFFARNELVELYQNQLKELIFSWNSFFRYMIANLLRKQTGKIMNKLEDIVAKEKIFFEEMLKNLDNCNMEIKNQSNWWLEHEEPGEILINENHIYMQTKKNHNAWNNDEALEVICYRRGDDEYNDILQLKVKLKSGYKQNNYHVGIMIKTIEGRMYIWGCYNEECLRLSDVGVKVNMKDFIISNLLDVRLSAIVENETLRLVAENDDGDHREVCLEKIVPYIKEVGIICKTWENDSREELKVEFEVIE